MAKNLEPPGKFIYKFPPGPRFPCNQDHCTSIYATAEDLKRHRKTVHRPQVKCEYIDCKVYCKPDYLWYHYKTHHKFDLEQEEWEKVLAQVKVKNKQKHEDKQESAKIQNNEKTINYEDYEDGDQDVFVQEYFKSEDSLSNSVDDVPSSEEYDPNVDDDVEFIPISKRAKSTSKKLCKKCNQSVASTRFACHQKVCNVANTFKCEVLGCTSTFPQKIRLQNHMMRIHQKEVKCKYCDAMIKPYDINRHVKRKHPDMVKNN